MILKVKFFSKLLSYDQKTCNHKNLSEISQKFAETYSYMRQLKSIKKTQPIDSVIKVIGDIKMNKLEKFSPIKEELQTIFDRRNLDTAR